MNVSSLANDVLPSPFDSAHLIVVRPQDFSETELTESAASPFNKQAARLGAKIKTSIRFAGNYTMWVRVSGPVSLAVQISQTDKPLLQTVINDGPGRPGTGGAGAYRDYRDKAVRNTPNNAVGDPALVQLRDLSNQKNQSSRKKDDDLADDLAKELRGANGENWVTTSRVDAVDKATSFYWWKIGPVALTPGQCVITISPSGGKGNALLDAAFLTTADKLEYPYIGDISIARASYVRFRLDKIPSDGLKLYADVNNHVYPYFRTAIFYLNPDGLSELKQEKHKSTGYTRWYCLQDVKKMVPITGHEVTLRIMDPAYLAEQGARGATQFAVFPHGDAVVRTIDWNEPEGLRISMSPDFEANPHQLRTVRDHAREYYEKALAAAENRPHLLARPGPLSITNYSATEYGEDYDYLAKSMRLLGFNSVGIRDPLKQRRNYGGTSTAGSSWTNTFLPYDEQAARKTYLEHYRSFFKPADADVWMGTDVFQIADEPAEAHTADMNAPQWRFTTEAFTSPLGRAKVPATAGGQWVDIEGGSDLNSRRIDYSDCVLEGTFTRLAPTIGFRVGLDRAEEPKRYVFWTIGKVEPGTPNNVATGRVGLPGESKYPVTSARPAMILKDAPTPFKIVYEGTRAALYVGGELANEQKDVPPNGGFGITGAAKAVSRLFIRPIRKGEHIAPQVKVVGQFVDPKAEAPGEELALDDPAKPTGPTKSLKETVETEWVFAGGIPEAQVAFLAWAAARGLKPELFGQKRWEDVHMLTSRDLVKSLEEARLYYWSRRYAGFLTPRMFRIAADEVRENSPNKNLLSFVGLSGHSHYFPSEMPLDMFELGNQGYPLIPGISDWMSLGSWRWDSHQSVAYSVAPFNAGARRWNADGSSASPASFPMMHCVEPNLIRSYTDLANNVKFLSYYTFGPLYTATSDYWSETPECYQATSLTCNRVGQVDDILSPSRMRPSRVALLYSHSTELWDSQSAYADRRATFLALSHEYFQPDLVTEDQISAGELAHFDALYVLDPYVSVDAQLKIAGWVKSGGLLWTCANSLTRDEYAQPLDGLAQLANIRRDFSQAQMAIVPHIKGIDPKAPADGPAVASAGQVSFRPHSVAKLGMPEAVSPGDATILATYPSTKMPGWLEASVGKGKVFYAAHRCGLTYTAKASRPSMYHDIWADTGRALITHPLIDAKVPRELVLSQPTVMASPMTSENGTVIVLYNMRPIPLKAVELRLREPAKPIQVQAFSGLKLVDVPYEYRDGMVNLTLSTLDSAQMVVIRRKPAPADARDEDSHRRAIAGLASKDVDDVSAAAWFAGFHPEWELGDRLVPLLVDPHWQVRRSAAEAIGRLGQARFAAPLIAVIRNEKDSHVIGDEIVALGRLHSDQTQAIAAEFLQRDEPTVRRLAIEAEVAFVGDARASAADRTGALQIALAAVSDNNLQVRRVGIRFMASLDPVQSVDLAARAYAASDIQSKHDRPVWVEAIAARDACVAEYVRRGLPGGDDLLTALAAACADSAIAKAIVPRLSQLDAAYPGKLGPICIRQADAALSRATFAARSLLSPQTVAYVPHILEHTFDAQLGAVIDDWDAWLKAHPDTSAVHP